MGVGFVSLMCRFEGHGGEFLSTYVCLKIKFKGPRGGLCFTYVL